jgi:type II secretory pathway component HofQ
VTFKGPLTKKQKDAQDQLVAMRPEIEKSIRSVNRRLVKNPDNANALRILRDLRQSLRQITEVEQLVKRRASKA